MILIPCQSIFANTAWIASGQLPVFGVRSRCLQHPPRVTLPKDVVLTVLVSILTDNGFPLGVIYRGQPPKKGAPNMKTHLLRWVPIALFLVVATISVALHLTRAAHEPCCSTPDLCQPYKQTPPCQPITCSDADRR